MTPEFVQFLFCILFLLVAVSIAIIGHVLDKHAKRINELAAFLGGFSEGHDARIRKMEGRIGTLNKMTMQAIDGRTISDDRRKTDAGEH